MYVTDFGLAKQMLARGGEATTRSGEWVGTLDYVAPEQIRGGRIDARADVYALGGVLCFLLTGRVPFERDGDEAKLWAQLSEPPPMPSQVRPGLPPELDGVVARAMAKAPERPLPVRGRRRPRRAGGGARASCRRCPSGWSRAGPPHRTVRRSRPGCWPSPRRSPPRVRPSRCTPTVVVTPPPRRRGRVCVPVAGGRPLSRRRARSSSAPDERRPQPRRPRPPTPPRRRRRPRRRRCRRSSASGTGRTGSWSRAASCG